MNIFEYEMRCYEGIINVDQWEVVEGSDNELVATLLVVVADLAKRVKELEEMKEAIK